MSANMKQFQKDVEYLLGVLSGGNLCVFKRVLSVITGMHEQIREMREDVIGLSLAMMQERIGDFDDENN